jgi:tRNA nucleotidyltransferase (CCA-adding enzyme)
VRTRSASTSDATVALPPSVARRVAEARALARERGVPLYLVGGAVRDVLLRRPVADVDLVLESDAPGFARALTRRAGATVTVHRRFGTAVVETPAGERLDFATVRGEDYERPGALPRVRPGSISEDLGRRDFTVNAMALEIAGSGRPRLVDPHGGRTDLARRLVRMLHGRSPFDDPTRSFRAVRYANRLDFRIEPETAAWIRSAVQSGAVDEVSGDRLRRELALLFSEPDRASAARMLHRLGLDRAIHPALSFDAAARVRMRTVETLAAGGGVEPGWMAWVLAAAGAIDGASAEAVARRLNLRRVDREALVRWPRTVARIRAAGASRGDLIAAIERLSEDEVAAAAAALPAPARRRLLAVREKTTGLRLQIRGRDLLAAGVPAGPAVGRALSATLSARRGGSIGPDEELSFAVKAARS